MNNESGWYKYQRVHDRANIVMWGATDTAGCAKFPIKLDGVYCAVKRDGDQITEYKNDSLRSDPGVDWIVSGFIYE